MEFMDEMPVENKQVKQKKKPIAKKVKPAEGFDLEIGSLTFYMGEIELELKDIKVKDMEEFREFLMEVMEK